MKIMNNNYLIFFSVTLAIKAREVLRKNGINSKVIKTPNKTSDKGCSYSLVIFGDINRAVDMIKRSGIKISGIIAADAQ